MWEVVIEAEISLLGIGSGQTIARAWTIAESLLHAENGLQPAEQAIRPFPLRKPISGLHPVAFRVLSVGILGAHFQRKPIRLPPEVDAGRIVVGSLQESSIGGSYFDPLGGEIGVETLAGGAPCLKLGNVAGRREIANVVDMDQRLGEQYPPGHDPVT